ncbi:hypothetical protein ABGB18_46585 [Nonomuraea sp. B12E4]|uniref:hypothetical protein n=1 Tax=Nonomuraea sp. B12E4 TaxID=3153564 RepID=UPI00325D1F34
MVPGRAGEDDCAQAFAKRLVRPFAREADKHDEHLDPAWVAVLARLYLPARFAFHVLQMTAPAIPPTPAVAAATGAAERFRATILA